MKNGGFLLTLPLLFWLLLLSCSDPENWYLNAAQSKAVLTPSSMHNGDTVSIFSRGTIGVQVYLREHLAFYTVSAPGNRLWHDTTVTPAHFNRNPMEFPISFFDTGWQEITLVSHRINGDSTTDHYRMYATSPLKQNPSPLEIIPGVAVTLSTQPVKDDVNYVWDFHSITVEHRMPSKQHTFDKFPGDQGELYVIDGQGIHSPSSFFVIAKKSIVSTVPQLEIQDPKPQNDTVFSPTPVVQIAGMITRAASIAKVTINEVAIDKFDISNDNYHFFREFKNLDSLLLITAVVTIVDTLNTITKDTVYIKYQPLINTTQPVIVLLNPLQDSSAADNEAIFIHGKVLNSGKYPSGVVTAKKNSNTIDGFISLKDGFFSLRITLDAGKNNLLFNFIEDKQSPSFLASKSIIVHYDPTVRDTTGPALFVLYEGQILDDSITIRRVDPSIRILLRDNSTINSVTVNGIPASRSADSANSLPTYSSTLSLNHPYTAITVAATDDYNNRSTIVYDSLMFNRLPVLTGDFSDYRGDAGHLFIWKTAVTDMDGDPLTITAIIKDQVIQISPDGSIQWRASINDVGRHTVKVQAYDSYETVKDSFEIAVSNQSTGIAVKWLTDSASIPATLRAGEDTLKVILRANTLSNLQPFYYNVVLTATNQILHNSTDSMFIWVPDSTHIGFPALKFTITDNANNRDMFTDAITVLPAAPALVQFLKASSGGNENSGSISLEVVLSKALNYPVQLDYAIDSAATTADLSDFSLPEVKTLTFLPGEDSKTIPVTIADNSIPDADRAFVVQLTNIPPQVNRGSQNSTTYTIFDNDFVTYTFSTSLGKSSSGLWSSRGVDSVFIEVALSQPHPKPVTLNCKVASEFTTAGSSDFTLPTSSQSLTIPAGKVKDTLVLLILPNNRTGSMYQPYYQKKVVALKLSANDLALREGNITLYKYTIGEETEFIIDSNTLSVYEDDSIKIIGMRRKDTIYSDVSVYFEVNKELTTAIEDVDFKLTTASPMIFEYTYLRSKQIKVRVFDNKIRESSKKVVIDITSMSSPGYLGSNPRIEITIKDDD